MSKIIWKPLAPSSGLSAPVSIAIEIGHNTPIILQQVSGVVKIADQLVLEDCHTIRITLINANEKFPALLEYHGLWLDRDGFLIDSGSDPTIEPPTPLPAASHLALDLEPGTSMQQHMTARPPPRSLEVVSSASGYSIMSNASDRGKNTDKQAKELQQWPSLLSSHMNCQYSTISAPVVCITKSCTDFQHNTNDSIEAQTLFFRTGPPSTPLFFKPWDFRNHYPSLLILDLGLPDFQALFAIDSPHSPTRRAIQQFTLRFVTDYAHFIQTVRSVAYPGWRHHGGHHELDHAYMQNSAPSTIPIFLMTPLIFRPSPRERIMHRYLTHAIQSVVSNLQKEGDTQTHWIDTTGWLSDLEASAHQGHLSPTEPSRSTHSSKSNTDPPPEQSIADTIQKRITSLLALHLCPYLSLPTTPHPSHSNHDSTHHNKLTNSSSSSTTCSQTCEFHKYAPPVRGNVYTLATDTFDKAVEQKKIDRIKELLFSSMTLVDVY